MEFLSKLETIINNLIIRFGIWPVRLVIRFTPAPVKKFYHRCQEWVQFLISNFKSLPRLLKEWAIKSLKQLKETLAAIDFKARINEAHQKAMAQYKAKSSKGMSAAKAMFLAPFLIIGQWLQGLTTVQATMLMLFTAASMLSGIHIISSGHRIIGSHQKDQTREPASVEDALKYDRPEYYKMERRHFQVTNLRLPVYFPEVNEIKSVDIDFSATMSNRASRKFLEKHEFQLRDHLILQLEPLIASFPLDPEGREVVRRKIWQEINDFLKQHKLEGHVEDLKVTYILAN